MTVPVKDMQVPLPSQKWKKKLKMDKMYRIKKKKKGFPKKNIFSASP